MSRRDFPALTGLRFFLALWVDPAPPHRPRAEAGGQRPPAAARIVHAIRGGYEAVTTFFVLSGFVLTKSYAATFWNERNTLRYAMGRVARVIPSIRSASWWWRRLSGGPDPG